MSDLHEFDITIVVEGRVRWGIRAKAGQQVIIPPDMAAEFGKRPQIAQLIIEPQSVPDSEVADVIRAVRRAVLEAKMHLDRLP